MHKPYSARATLWKQKYFQATIFLVCSSLLVVSTIHFPIIGICLRRILYGGLIFGVIVGILSLILLLLHTNRR